MKNDNNKTMKQEEQIEEEETEINDQVRSLQQIIEDLENKYKRALADYQNLQKRISEEKADWIRLANKELLLRFLPVLDTLVLANQHVEDEGLKVTINQFLSVLKSEGVTRIETIGKEFNPEFMEAVMTGEGKKNIVLEDIRVGYMMNDKLLRPAQVKVGQ
jgi:molecular chaperone GrpE